MRILVVEDDPFSADMLADALREFDYEPTLARNGREAFDLLRTGRFQLVVSDWEMPEMSGLELCRRIRARRWAGYIYCILLTSHAGVESIVHGLEAGADDFVTKPFHPHELRVRLSAGERLLSLEGRDLTIFALAKLAESRDPETGSHLERIREYCRILAEELSHSREFGDTIDGEFIELLYLTTPLHDIGKVGIPDNVLLKPGKLSAEEFEVMKQHTLIGGNTLRTVARLHAGRGAFLDMACDIAFSHHERFDGRGYPYGLAGDAIPLCSRITALADVYDALTNKRVYKPAFSHDESRKLILDGQGSQFDPRVVEAFLACEDEFQLVRERFMNATSPFDGVRLLDQGSHHEVAAMPVGAKTS